jgi:hypothetical protein
MMNGRKNRLPFIIHHLFKVCVNRSSSVARNLRDFSEIPAAGTSAVAATRITSAGRIEVAAAGVVGKAFAGSGRTGIKAI